MKKEVIIAITVGFIIGLIITFGIYQAQRLYLQPKVEEVVQTPTTSPSPTSENQHSLQLIAPENFGYFEVSPITLTGFSSPNAYVTIATVTQEYVTQANQSGSFSSEVVLEEGANILRITAIDANGARVSEDVTVTYVNSQTGSEQETNEADNEESNDESQE